jgi:hypothetical protein
MRVNIIRHEKDNLVGRLAEAEMHFDLPASDGVQEECREQLERLARSGALTSAQAACLADALNTARALDGLKLIGFSIWERRSGGGRNVTFPARQYTISGERRSFALLRPIAHIDAQERVRDSILAAFAEHQARQS